MADGAHGEADRATFHAMTESTAEDWARIAVASVEYGRELPDRILTHLNLLKGDCGGFVVDRLEHSLQTATRAFRDGRDEEYVVCALLHDIGDVLCPRNHPDIGAAMVFPYVSEANHWMVQQHGIFQGYYFFHHLGLDRDMREQFRGHPHFEYTAQFCHQYDQNAFDPNYESMPLEAFTPMLQRVMAVPKRSIYLRQDAEAIV
ncbi:HD domain-containing protein [Brevundimonas sp.]|uniref:HD domain-containing protein n=1 Tax=Brevundimonas sp. TaxID=1871086 RepID=UPI002ABCDE86|nr:HD domain-containing protein [Brevundimonas sp.]MDZ4362801.1 phosphohydrolase [Brevundimonas sp.]